MIVKDSLLFKIRGILLLVLFHLRSIERMRQKNEGE